MEKLVKMIGKTYNELINEFGDWNDVKFNKVNQNEITFIFIYEYPLFRLYFETLFGVIIGVESKKRTFYFYEVGY